MLASSNIDQAGPAIGLPQTNAKTAIYFKKNFPLRMTADMEPIGEDQLYSVNISKRLYVLVMHDAPFEKVQDGVTYGLVHINQIHGRLWFKDP